MIGLAVSAQFMIATNSPDHATSVTIGCIYALRARVTGLKIQVGGWPPFWTTRSKEAPMP